MCYHYVSLSTLMSPLTEPVKTKSFHHINMFFLSPEGYIDMYPIDVGAFSLMRDQAVVIPFAFPEVIS